MSASYLPEPVRSPEVRPIQRIQAAWTVRGAEMELFRDGVRTSVRVRKEMNHSQAAGDAVRCNLEEEIGVLQYGHLLAGDDPQAQALVDRKVQQLSVRNDRRLLRDGF